ncbi:hypothetical protein AB0H36_10280 [Kribbella sp. NPDC050820]|uniref:amidohydrolase family protein n=1 Tax=Kribbella sp. NPDC050820 TaxID=3155408 RepID=UPI003407D838
MCDEVTSGWFDARIVTGAHPASLLPPTDRDSIAAHLDKYAMSGALVSSMASWLHDPIGGNAEASAVAHSLADRGVLACWTAVPPTPGELHSLDGLVEQAVADGVAAFRLYPRSHGYSPMHSAMHDLYAGLASHGLPLCVDLTEIDWNHLDHIATRFPTLPIVLSSLGYRQLRNLWAAMRDHGNLYVDQVDFAGHQAIEWLARHELADRLLFATGLGLRDPGESIIRLAWSGLTDDTVTQIGANTATRLFGVPTNHRNTADHDTDGHDAVARGTDARGANGRSPDGRGADERGAGRRAPDRRGADDRGTDGRDADGRGADRRGAGGGDGAGGGSRGVGAGDWSALADQVGGTS